MFAYLRGQKYFLFEILVTLKYVAFFAPGVATGMLIQDKICLVNYQQEPSFCQHLEKEQPTQELQLMKDQILSSTGQFTNYKSLAETIPILYWSLLLGPFLDAYPNASFLIFLVSLLGDIFAAASNLFMIYFYNSSPYFMLVSSLSMWLTGGMLSFGTTTILFVSTNSTETNRGFKFIFMEIVIIVGIAGATILGGQLLRTQDDGPRIRTYHYNYLFAISMQILALVTLFLLYLCSRGDKPKETQVKKEEASQIEEPKPNALKAFLSVDSVRQTIRSFFRPRPQHVRLQIFILCFIQFSQMAIGTGLGNLMTQFAQKVYNWGPTEYSTLSAVQQIGGMGMLALSSLIFIKWLKFSDSNLIFIAQISNFFADLIRGTFLSKTAFYISVPVGCLNGYGIVSAKAKFSKIVPKDEAGKIFSLNATVEALVPLAASFIYSNLFTLSISTYPGLIYHFSCLLMIFTVGALMIEKRYCPVTSQDDLETLPINDAS